MTTDRWRQIKAVFQVAAEMEPAARLAYLDEACAGEPDLRREVDSLLASSEEAGDFIEKPALHHSAVSIMEAVAPDLAVGRRVGPYRIITEVGSGGMGSVYRAVRDDDHFHQQVAIKIIKRGMDTDYIVRRFRNERQILAGLDHPNIARLLDGGATEEGLPYYVMEYIEGRPIDEYCDSNKLSTAERLRLYQAVGSAIHYAHQKLVVHRDIKPWNILITSEGVPKLLDFGIAKILDPELSTQPGDPTITDTALRMMTPAYASPEQIRGEVITPASDVYSLGVLLYELLTGHRPYRFKSRAPHEMAQVICEQEPDRPSSAVNRTEEITVTGPQGSTRVMLTPEVVSYTREGEPRKLRQCLEGDLDSIVLMAMRKEPAYRYSSVQAFCDDIQQYLEGGPVYARRADFGYRAGKWITRRKLGMGIAAAIVALSLAGTFEYQRLTRAPSRAGPFKVRPSIAVWGFRNLSGKPQSAWLSTALTEMLSTELAAGEQLRAVSGEAVEQVKLDLALADSDSFGRETLARIRTNLGADYVVLGSYLAGGGAESPIHLDLRLQDAVAGDTIISVSEAGAESDLPDLVARVGMKVRERLGAGGISGAEAGQARAASPANAQAVRYYSEGLHRLRIFDTVAARDSLEKAVTADPNHALSHSALAMAYTSMGDDVRATAEAKKALDQSKDLPRETRLFIEGRYYETINSWEKAEERYQALYVLFPDNLDYGLRLVAARMSAGPPQEALRTIDELRRLPPPAPEDPRLDVEEASAADLIADYKRELAAATRGVEKGTAQGSRILVARAKYLQGRALTALGKPAEAIPVFEEAKAIYMQFGHRRGVARSLFGVASAKLQMGDTEGASALHEESLAISREIGNRSGTAAALYSLGSIRQQQGRFEVARDLYREAGATWRELGERSSVATALDALSSVLMDLGSLSEAKKTEAEALALDRQMGDERMLARDQSSLAQMMRYEGELAVSKNMYQESIAIRRKLSDSAGLSAALNGYSRLLADQGDLAGAKKAILEALEIDRKQGTKRALSNSLFQMATITLAEDDSAGAKPYHTESLALRAGIGNKNLEGRNHLALAQWNLEEGRADLAEPLAIEAAAGFRAQKAAHLEAVAESVVALSEAQQKKSGDAQRAIGRASLLQPKIELRQLRLSTGTTLARANALLGKRAEAIENLEKLLVEATQLGLVAQQFEIRLALGEMEIQSGAAAKGKARLTALNTEAAGKGYRLIARKALLR